MVPDYSIGDEPGAGVLNTVRGHVKLAYLDSGVDSRVGLLLQQNSAFRDHIVDHHRELAELGADWSCHAGVLAVPPKGTTADAEKAG